MISVEASRAGPPVLTKDGKYLESSVDPVAAGERWAAQAKAQIGAAESAIVLGLGSGYHVLALRKACPELKFIVVEGDPRVAQEAQRILPDLKKIAIVANDDWSQLLEIKEIRAMTHEFFRVVKHQPSLQINDLYYQRAEAMLLARDRIGFFLQLRDRMELLRISDMEKLEGVAPGAISIKTVLESQKQGPHGAYEQEALLWQVLGELVR